MSKLKKGLLISGIIIACIITGGVVLFFSISKKLEAYNNINVSDLDLSSVEDGTYTGKEDADIIKVTVDVTVKDHKITDIKLVEHQNGLGAPAEVIVEDIVESNSLEVDTISGATHSSNVIRQAVYNALTQ